MFNFHAKVFAKYYVITADFKTAAKKFMQQGVEESLVEDYLDKFKKLRDKNLLSGDDKNIDLWSNKRSFYEFKNRIDDIGKERTKTEKKKLAKTEGAKLVAENEGWKVYEILDHKACMLYGSNTKWCITEDDGYYWNEYSNKFTVYYFISKNLSAKEPWYKIALLIDRLGGKTLLDATDKEHYSLPATLNVPNFKEKKPPLWKLQGINLDVSKLFLLKSLEGAPTKVDGDFNCSDNKLTSLKYAPTKVGGDFNCSRNKLTSLEHAPKEVGGDFNCSDNQKKFTEEEVRAVCDVKGDVYV